MWWIRVTPANVKSRGTADNPEEQQGAGEPVDEPARGDAGDPRADVRDALPAKEEPKIPVLEGAREHWGHLKPRAKVQ